MVIVPMSMSTVLPPAMPMFTGPLLTGPVVEAYGVAVAYTALGTITMALFLLMTISLWSHRGLTSLASEEVPAQQKEEKSEPTA